MTYYVVNTKTKKIAIKQNATTLASYQRKAAAEKYAAYLNQGLAEKVWEVREELKREDDT